MYSMGKLFIFSNDTSIRYDRREFNVDSKAVYTAY